MNNEETLEPLALTIEQTCRVTNESKTKVYDHVAKGEYDAVKSGRRTLILFESIKRRLANLPRVQLQRKTRQSKGSV